MASSEDRAERLATIADAVGLHLRVAARIVETAASFESRVMIDGADARSMVALLRLGALQGRALRVVATGPDADAAAAAIADELGR